MRGTLKTVLTASFLAYFIFIEVSLAYEAPAMGLSTSEASGGVVVDSVDAASPAEAAGIRAGDRIISMDDITIDDGLAYNVAAANVPLATPVIWTVERSGARVTLPMPPIYRRWIPLGSPTNIAFVGFATAIFFGLLVLWKGPPGATTWLGSLALLSLGCGLLPLYPASFLWMWRDLPRPIEVLIWPAAFASLFGPYFMFAFCWQVTNRLGNMQIASLMPGMALSGFTAYFVTLSLYSPSSATQLLMPDWFWLIGSLISTAYYFAGLYPLASGARRSRDVTERRRARTMIAGVAVGGVGILFFAMMASMRLSGVNRTRGVAIWMWIAVALFSAMPASFAYATLRQRLFDLRVIVRLGLQYALARNTIAAIIPIAIVALIADAALHSDQTLRSILASRGLIYGAIAAIAAVVYFNRDQWVLALDRRFFRERYAAHQILKDVVEAIGQSSSFDTAAEKVAARVDSALHPWMTAVMIRPRTSTAFSIVAKRPDSTRISALQSGTPITEVVRALGRPVVFGPKGLHDIPPAQMAWLTESNVEVVVPIVTDLTRDEAMLVLGPRRSEEPYSREDLDLLATIGASLALLIGRPPAAAATTVLDAGVGMRIGNRYRIQRPIGEGGMGLVYAAIDETLERPVAVKVIKDQHLLGDGLGRFQREAKMAASLTHPHIVTIHDFGTDDTGSPYLVMELLEGQSLRTAIKSGGRLPVERSLAILSGIASAVDAAHARGIIHRDLKPENVFLTSDTHAKILDYGIAKAIESNTTFGTPGVAGTLAYMAPEQASGGEASPSWDVWALTVIAFEMLTGKHPFGGGLPITPPARARSVAQGLSESIDLVLDRSLSLNPGNRYATASQFVQELEPEP